MTTATLENVKTTEKEMKVFCVIGDPMLFSDKGSRLIECNFPKLWQRQGINQACVSLSHLCYDVTYNAYKKLIKDGFTEVSQAEYCRIYNL